MADDQLLSKIHSLSDLELAFLLSLIAREHCQIRTPSSADIPDLVAELRLLSTKVFNLQPAVIACTPQTTLDDFASALLLPPSPSSPGSTNRSVSPFTTRSPRNNNHNFDPQPSSSYFRSSPVLAQTTQSQTPSIAPVILAANLDQAPKAVQIQALELLRTRRVFTRTSVHIAPKTFLFVAVVSDDGPGELNKWLNEWFYIAHRHTPDDGYPNLEEEEEEQAEDRGDYRPYQGDSDAASTTSSPSVVIKPSGTHRRMSSIGGGYTYTNPLPTNPQPLLTDSEISLLSQRSTQVHADIDVTRYQMNIVSFLRMHRAVAGGITPTASKHFEQLVKSLAPLHGLDYVTPSLVQLAARKVYLHRIQIVAPERERSMQWGSELAAVEAVLEGVGAEDVIEDVLAMVTVPL